MDHINILSVPPGHSAMCITRRLYMSPTYKVPTVHSADNVCHFETAAVSHLNTQCTILPRHSADNVCQMDTNIVCRMYWRYTSHAGDCMRSVPTVHSVYNIYHLETICVTYILSVTPGHSADYVNFLDYMDQLHIKCTPWPFCRQSVTPGDNVCHLHTKCTSQTFSRIWVSPWLLCIC